MAKMKLFHYIPGNSIIHTLDSRIKLFIVVLFCTIGFFVRFTGIILNLLLIIISILLSKIRIHYFLNYLKPFLLLFLILFVVRSYSFAGTCAKLLFLPIPNLGGIIEAMLIILRLLSVILIGFILSTTTTISSLHLAVYSILKHIPIIPAAQIATMMSLTILFFPLLIDKIEEINEASKARCIDNNKNPFSRIFILSISLLMSIGKQADEIAEAMEARCYTGERRELILKVKKHDLLFLFYSVLSAIIIIITIPLL